jgi:hypothetical protein
MWLAWERRHMDTGSWVGNPEGKRPLAALKCGWQDNIRGILKK